MWIIFWIVAALMSALANSFWKKSIDHTSLSTSMFSLFWPVGWLIIISSIFLINWYNFSYLLEYKLVLLAIFIAIMEIIIAYMDLYVFKKIKMSYILPYENSNKIFVILIWFFLYFGTKNSTSIETFLITLLAVFIIVWFSLDFKSLKFDRLIWIYLWWKILSAINILLIWYILLSINTVNYMSINVIVLILIYILIITLWSSKISNYKNQSKIFYKSKILATILWWSWYIIGIYLIESQWLLIATLLWFIGLVFSIISMKFILNDTPSKKQILLAFIVSILIWVWYYFK